MPKVTIAGQEYIEVSRSIARRSPTIDPEYLPISAGFKAEINDELDQLVIVTSGGIVLVKDTETDHLPWDAIQSWDGQTLVAGDDAARIRFAFDGSTVRFEGFLEDISSGVVGVVDPVEDRSRQGTELKLSACPDCDGTVSRRASNCVHCGAPLPDNLPGMHRELPAPGWSKTMLSNSSRQTGYLQSFWWVLLIFLGLNALMILFVVAGS